MRKPRKSRLELWTHRVTEVSQLVRALATLTGDLRVLVIEITLLVIAIVKLL